MRQKQTKKKPSATHSVVWVTAVVIAAVMVDQVADAVGTAWRVTRAVKAWQETSRQDTVTWVVQEWLSCQGWLGFLRPDPLLDPLRTYWVEGRSSLVGLVWSRQDTRQSQPL